MPGSGNARVPMLGSLFSGCLVTLPRHLQTLPSLSHGSPSCLELIAHRRALAIQRPTHLGSLQDAWPLGFQKADCHPLPFSAVGPWGPWSALSSCPAALSCVPSHSFYFLAQGRRAKPYLPQAHLCPSQNPQNTQMQGRQETLHGSAVSGWSSCSSIWETQ